jgi:archaemetzincin
MNGANSLVESDSAPVHVCPVCLEKLAWNIGFDSAKRHRELADLLEAEGLKDDAAWERAAK